MSPNKPEVVAIYGYKLLGEFDYRVEYERTGEDDRIRVIYAPNGWGKTNFLRAVDALLNSTPESLQSLIDIPFGEISVQFSNGGSIQARREHDLIGTITLSLTPRRGDPSISIPLDPNEMNPRALRRIWQTDTEFLAFSETIERISPGSVYIGDDRLVDNEETRENSRLPNSQFTTVRRRSSAASNLLDAVERMFVHAAISGMSREGSQAGVYSQITKTTLRGSSKLSAIDARIALQEQILRILSHGEPLETYALLSLRQLRDIAQQIESTRANARELPAVHAILRPYLDSVEDQIKTLSPAHSLIDTFVKSVNTFLNRKHLRFSASGGITLVGRDDNTLQPDGLSSGERHLLLLLSQAVLANSGRPLVIIDEPELSLGIEWQRTLLQELLKCSSSGQVKFLIASHSLQVMNAVSREEIVTPTEQYS